MAKTAWINRNERKRATVKKYAALRAELKAKKDYAGLAQLPRDASPTRVVNRCEVTGRRRAFIRRFKMSRLTFFFFSSRRRHTRWTGDWSSDVCSSDLADPVGEISEPGIRPLTHRSA